MFSICLLLFASDGFAAGWGLDAKASSLAFVSIKKSSVAEVHHFERLRGSLSDKGQLRMEIALGSVETGIPIRNSRMTSMLFEVAKFPKAEITASVSPKIIEDLSIGRSVRSRQTLTMSLHGNQHDIEADVLLIRLADDSLVVTSVNPIVINASDYDLAEGIERLRGIAKLPRIATAVPVTFQLTFVPVH